MVRNKLNINYAFALRLGYQFNESKQCSKKENLRLLKKTGEYDDMKNEAKEILKSSTEVKTVKSLREKYGLSLMNAKKIVDSVK